MRPCALSGPNLAHRVVARRLVTMPTFVERFLNNTSAIVQRLDQREVEAVVDVVAKTHARGGRLFLCGSGGGRGARACGLSISANSATSRLTQ